MSRDRLYFLLRKLHSLTGIVPIGVFLLVHLFLNCGALLGECNFTEGVRTINMMPYVHYIEVFGIIVPLAFHGLLGLWMVFVQARYNNASYTYSRNWWYTAQRLTGLLIFVFLCWHLWDTVLAKLMGQITLEQFYQHLLRGMSSDMLFLTMFVVGTVAASFHLANGAWGFCASWGVLQSRKAQRVGAWAFGLAGAALFAVWLNVIMHFASGGPVGPDNWIPVQEPPLDCGATLLADISER
jgi:succinate dehydrogenase/fumarate reductase cytochrome b subunit (b558 family)